MIIPAGKWIVDASHSSVNFSVKHLMISKVKGSFGSFSGEAITTENILETKITASVEVSSIDTKDSGRDTHLVSPDFFDAANSPVMTFTSTKIAPTSKENIYDVTGDLTIKGVTLPVTAKAEFGGVATDPYGNTKGAAEVTFVVDRTKFGLTWNAALETGGVLVGNDITVTLDLQATLEK